MEPNEETAPIVQMIFEWARDGYTPNKVVKALLERNIPTPAEYKAAHGFHGHDISRCCGIWPESSVIHILEDERYTGTYIIGKREVTEVGGHHVRMKDECQWVKIPDHHPAIISKELFDQVQAQVILNVADLSNAGKLDVQLAEQAEYDKQIENYLGQKRVLYEQFILKQITMEDYKVQKSAVDSEPDRLRSIRFNLKMRPSQMEMDEKSKRARTELAREVVGAAGSGCEICRVAPLPGGADF